MLPHAPTAALRHLVVGHVCWDEFADGRVVLGGTAYFAGVQAATLGCRVTIETVCTPATEGALRALLGPGVAVQATGSDVDTRFAFESAAGVGPTRLVCRAPAVASVDTAAGFDSAHVAPIAGEVGDELVQSLRERVRFLGITAQGLLREFSAGVLRHDRARPVTVLGLADAVVVNEAEYALLASTQPDVLRDCPAPVFVTRGSRGASLLRGGEEVARRTAARVARDPGAQAVGAGDVFASAVFVGLACGGPAADVLEQAVSAASAFVARPLAVPVGRHE